MDILVLTLQYVKVRKLIVKIKLQYRVTLVVAYLGWVDYDFGHSSVCLVLLGQMGIWQKRLVNRARWWNRQNQSPRNRGTRPPGYLQ